MRRRAIIAAIAALAATAALAPAAPAADTSVSVASACSTPILPSGVGGVTIYVAGQPFRVAKYEDLQFCVGESILYTDLTPVTNYGACGSPCMTLHTPVWLKSGSVSADVCYTADGSRRCLGVAPVPIGVGTPPPCIFAIGQPAPVSGSSCLVVVDQDTLLGVID